MVVSAAAAAAGCSSGCAAACVHPSTTASDVGQSWQALGEERGGILHDVLVHEPARDRLDRRCEGRRRIVIQATRAVWLLLLSLLLLGIGRPVGRGPLLPSEGRVPGGGVPAPGPGRLVAADRRRTLPRLGHRRGHRLRGPSLGRHRLLRQVDPARRAQLERLGQRLVAVHGRHRGQVGRRGGGGDALESVSHSVDGPRLDWGGRAASDGADSWTRTSKEQYTILITHFQVLF